MNILAPPEPVLSGPHRLTVRPVPGSPVPDAEAWFAMLRDIGAVATQGGISAQSVGRPTFAVTRFEPAEGALTADLEIEGIDSRVLAIPVSVLATAGLSGDVAEVSLARADGRTGAVPPPDAFAEGTVYPTLRSGLSFGLERDETVTSWSRRLVVTFPHHLTRDDLHRLDDWLAPWGAVLEAGGFVLPNDAPEETLNTYAGVQLFERDSAEIVIDRFESSEEAFDILLNMLDAFSARVDRISLVEQF